MKTYSIDILFVKLMFYKKKGFVQLYSFHNSWAHTRYWLKSFAPFRIEEETIAWLSLYYGGHYSEQSYLFSIWQSYSLSPKQYQYLPANLFALPDYMQSKHLVLKYIKGAPYKSWLSKIKWSTYIISTASKVWIVFTYLLICYVLNLNIHSSNRKWKLN